MSTAAIHDDDGDELRVEPDRRGLYVTVSQEECTATAGPFTVEELRAILALAEGGAR